MVVLIDSLVVFFLRLRHRITMLYLLCFQKPNPLGLGYRNPKKVNYLELRVRALDPGLDGEPGGTFMGEAVMVESS